MSIWNVDNYVCSNPMRFRPAFLSVLHTVVHLSNRPVRPLGQSESGSFGLTYHHESTNSKLANRFTTVCSSLNAAL